MGEVAVLGASGIVGGEIAASLQAAGHGVVGVGHDRERLAVVPGVTRRFVPGEDGDLKRVLAEVDLVVLAAGDRTGTPTAGPRVAALKAAVAAGCAVIDVEPEQAAIRRAVETAREARAAVVLGAGLQPGVGLLLARIAAGAVSAPTEVLTAYTFPGGPLPPGYRGASSGRRGSAAAVLGDPGVVRERGVEVTELAGETRRLAWFPKPVGPSHAAGVPSGEVDLLRLGVPPPSTVRGAIALPAWRAELLQAVAGLARWSGPGRRLRRRLTARRPEPSPARRAAQRWGCVAEVAGPGQVARAWAYGHDVSRLTAQIAVICAGIVLAGGVPPGPVGPDALEEPSVFLDELGRRTDTRWSLVRP